MPPRKSISRARPSRAVDEPVEAPRSTDAVEPSSSSHAQQQSQPQPTASTSKVTLDMPPIDVPEDIVWEYEAAPKEPQVLTEEDKERIVHELMNFSPFNILHDISEHARGLIYPTVASVEGWARAMAGGREEHDREVDTGSHALETLLESYVDRAFDIFTAYALRNVFKVPAGVEPVMPWHSGIDFDRAKFVTTLPGGEATLADRLTSLRDQVEQARLVRHRLALAEAELDRRLEIAAHRRAEVGFVHDGVQAAGLAPLPTNAQAMTAALMGLHDRIKDVDVPMGVGVGAAAAVSGGGVGGGDGTGGKWEAGRQAYLSWAVDKALAKGVGDGALDGAERAAKAVGSVGDMDALARVVQ
ncbi:uncharacterized protein EHS24_004275 [Apiotrichum porosum]|uniref:Uncharacterized protein n=1 Tax=Apiotrichum porosum TaxID=105984 RepID=A0A427Y4S0_9TREE|nr:uncharacterized protein EHS24_004275 [Apiotrichum porosum]RSH86065.1 hypothetical protein EHS24_004275 [Apiotrichum porosum]